MASSDNALHVFSTRGSGTWTRVHTLPSLFPAALLLSPDNNFLYVANAVETVEHRPTGSITAYAIDQHTGSLTLINHQPLALFSTTPSHLAVSPNGRRLAVAAGPAINLLPLEADGRVGRVTACVRPLGVRAFVGLHAIFFEDDTALVAHHATVSRFAVGSGGSLAIDGSPMSSPKAAAAPSSAAPAWFGVERAVAVAVMSSRSSF